MQTFNANNILGRYIKNLISDTYICTAPIWKAGQPIVKGTIYVADNHIVKALEDVNNTELTDTIYTNNRFKIICPFIEGEYYPAITCKCMSDTGIYNSDTHYHLGQYLRQLRDLHGLDLMQYYNCYNNVSTDSYRIRIRIKTNTTKDSGVTTTYSQVIEENNTSDGYKLIAVPVRFNQKYTIYLNSQSPIMYGFTYYDGVSVLSNKTGTETDRQINLVNGGRNAITFDTPLVIESPNASADGIGRIWDQVVTVGGKQTRIYLEKFLTLFIQVPIEQSSPIIVLEGDYSKNKLVFGTDNKTGLLKHWYGADLSSDFEKSTYSVCSLTTKTKTYAFSDRLVEYLTLNAITPLDSIYKNIVNAQKDTATGVCKRINGINYPSPMYGTYSNDYKNFIYELATENLKSPLLYDINGYIDKDTESVVLRGKIRDDKKWGEE